MKRRTRSILEEITTAAPGTTKRNIVEDKSQHILESPINIIQEFYQVYNKEEAQDLHKKFINSIRSLDEKKFYRSLARKDEN